MQNLKCVFLIYFTKGIMYNNKKNNINVILTTCFIKKDKLSNAPSICFFGLCILLVNLWR